MGMHKRYSGSFLSRQGTEWRVDILQESAQAFGEVGELDFPAETPVVISWEEKSKEKPLVSSVAEITIISPGDRTYEDLYTIAPGLVRADIYRGNDLYWSGTLDPEFYEEPYERAKDYDVKLTFSDFGILDRMPYDGAGVQTLADICDLAVSKAGIAIGGIDRSMVSTAHDGGAVIAPDDLSVRADNFYDEDGEAMTMADVIESVLQPLGLRMVQRAGILWIHDLNGLYESGTVRSLDWSSDRQTLGVDKVVNNVSITFSPYSDTTVGDASFAHDEVNKDDDNPTLYYIDYNWDQWQTVEGFKLFTGDRFAEDRFEGLPVQSIGGGVPFRIDSVYSGSEDAGIAWLWRGSKDNYDDIFTSDRFTSSETAIPLIHPGINDNMIRPMVTTARLPLFAGDAEREKFKLRVCCDMLLDARYNPFEQVSEFNEQGNYDAQQRMRKVFIPARLILHRHDGTKLHYTNHKTVTSGTFVRTEFNSLRPDAQMDRECGWRTGEGEWGEFWLSYYDISNLENAYGDGWVSNRPAVGASWFAFLPKLWSKRRSGEYIILPDYDGDLELQLGAGLYCRECVLYVSNDGTVHRTAAGDNLKNMRWMLFRNISVSIVRENGTDIDTSDVEYQAEINPDAKEKLSLDTRCGSAKDGMAGARGLYIYTDSNLPVRTLTRAGVSDCPERLLINTIYSQYADRHIKLSGEADIDAGGLCVYNERCQGSRVFMITGETQDLIADVSDVTAVELSPEEYEAKD